VETPDAQQVNQLLSICQNDPKTMMTVLGTTVGESSPQYIQQLYEGWGTGLFHKNHLNDRIDFLYDTKCAPISRDAQILFRKEILMRRNDGVVCITDKLGEHGYVNLMLLRGMSDNMQVYYAIREFVPDDELATGFLAKHWPRRRGAPTFKNVLGEGSSVTSTDFFGIGTSSEMKYVHVFDEDCIFWNFSVHEDHLDAVPESFGWRDIAETGVIARFICLCTNLLGFVTD
jgi:hypothetical protein